MCIRDRPDVGQIVIAIDPAATAGDGYLDRLEQEFTTLMNEPGVRLPGDRRLASRADTEQHGVEVPDDLLTVLRSYVKEGH